ncbi:hypothetical protein HDV03_005166 [Kappamyces sp. JEL0829]|nr:hypothetical protein HDV03_005166 [Kappamyces sp. JEL0829]
MTVALQFGWYGVENSTRPCDSTYDFYATIPAIPESKLNGLEFLRHENPQAEKWKDIEESMHPPILGSSIDLAALKREYPQAVTSEFVTLMSSKELQNQIPSCTACYFDLGRAITHVPGLNIEVLLFYRDQQDCLLWYLIMTGEHEGQVLGTPFLFEEINDWEKYNEKVLYRHSKIVSTSFTEFIYRTWIENHLWFAENEGGGVSLEDVPADGEVYGQAFIDQECRWYLKECKAVADSSN